MGPFDAERLHQASLRILEEVGVRLEHDEVRQRVLAAGARPGSGPNDVRFPPEMVREHLALAPSTVELASRDGRTTCLTPTSEPVFWTCPVLHFWTGSERRDVTSADLAVVARLCDHLDGVQGVMGVSLADVAPAHRDFVGLRLIAENGRKHARALCFTGRGMEALVRMKPVFPGPWFSVGFTAHGPLRWTHLALDIFLKSAGHAVPATVNGEPMAGVTAPVTPAGAVAVGNAEILSGIVVNQVLEPGRPLIYNLGLAHVMDMRHSTAVTGGPENAFFAQASAALGRFYRLPSASWASTEALLEDEQAALEKMFALQTHTAAGVSLVWGLGQLESEMTLSLAQLVIDDEMVAFVRRFRRGFGTGEADVAIDLIREVGIAGSFLETEHTLRHHRHAVFTPHLLNRRARWGGAEPLPHAARCRARALLEGDTAPRISEAEAAELRRVEEHFRGDEA
jgi:trimethylamine--corrinoid protein Co-methyltransferase